MNGSTNQPTWPVRIEPAILGGISNLGSASSKITHPSFPQYCARDPFREARINTSTICLTVPSVPPPHTWAKNEEEAGVAQSPPTPRAEGRLRLTWGGREEAKNPYGARTDAGRLLLEPYL